MTRIKPVALLLRRNTATAVALTQCKDFVVPCAPGFPMHQLPMDNGTPDQSFTLILRPTSVQARVEGLSKTWERVRDDYAVLDGETCVGRIYRQAIHGVPTWLWFLQTEPAPPPNSGMADTLEECAADFKRRYALIRDTHGPERG